jgi:hypothetical protein
MKGVYSFIILSIFVFTITSFSYAQIQWALDTVINTGANSSGIAITPDNSKIIVTNNTSPGTIKIISTSDYSITSISYSADGYPNGVIVTQDGSNAIVNTMHQTLFIDLSTNKIVGNFVAPCASTTLYGLAANSSNVIYPDLSSGCTQQGLRIINIAAQNTSSFIPVKTAGELYGITLAGSNAIVSAFNAPPVNVNLLTQSIQTIKGLSSSYGLAALHNGTEALVLDGDSLYRVSLSSNSVTKTLSALGATANFQNIAITADDKYAFAVGDFEKLIISLDNDSLLQTFSAGGTNVATTSDGSRFFVTDSYNGTVRVYKKTGTTAITNVHNNLPSAYELYQNYPNPFNPTTKITYVLPFSSNVKIDVYNLIGEKVKQLVNEQKDAGNYEVNFNSSGLASGVYFYIIYAKSLDGRYEYRSSKKMITLK